MGRFVRGDVVITTYPFADLSGNKKRPALVIAEVPVGRVLLCQITSQDVPDPVAVSLALADFKEGRLKRDRVIRPNYLFTAEENLIEHRAGIVSDDKLQEVVDKIIQFVSAT